MRFFILILMSLQFLWVSSVFASYSASQCAAFFSNITSRPDLNYGRAQWSVDSPPPILFRVVYELPKYTKNNTMIASMQRNAKEEWSVPMASEIDVNNMIDFFLNGHLTASGIEGIKPAPKMYLLEIDTSKLKEITASYDPRLEDLEYFGYAPKEAIRTIKKIVFTQMSEEANGPYAVWEYSLEDIAN